MDTQVTADKLRVAMDAARKLRATTINFALSIPHAAAGIDEYLAVVSDCLSHWGDDCIALRKALEQPGVSEAFSRVNLYGVSPFGREFASYHTALLAMSWGRLRSVQLVCGFDGVTPTNIDPNSVSLGMLSTMAGAMVAHGGLNSDSLRVDLLKEYQRSTETTGECGANVAEIAPGLGVPNASINGDSLSQLALVVGDENSAEIIRIARGSQPGEEKYKQILRIDPRFAGKSSAEAGKLLGVTASAVRGYQTWKDLKLKEKMPD